MLSLHSWCLHQIQPAKYKLVRLELSNEKLKFKMLTNTSVASEAFAGPLFQKEDPNPLFLDSPFPLLQEFVFQ